MQPFFFFSSPCLSLDVEENYLQNWRIVSVSWSTQFTAEAQPEGDTFCHHNLLNSGKSSKQHIELYFAKLLRSSFAK